MEVWWRVRAYSHHYCLKVTVRCGCNTVRGVTEAVTVVLMVMAVQPSARLHFFYMFIWSSLWPTPTSDEFIHVLLRCSHSTPPHLTNGHLPFDVFDSSNTGDRISVQANRKI